MSSGIIRTPGSRRGDEAGANRARTVIALIPSCPASCGNARATRTVEIAREWYCPRDRPRDLVSRLAGRDPYLSLPRFSIVNFPISDDQIYSSESL